MGVTESGGSPCSLSDIFFLETCSTSSLQVFSELLFLSVLVSNDSIQAWGDGGVNPPAF